MASTSTGRAGYSIDTVGQLNAAIAEFPDDMPVFVVQHDGGSTYLQHNLQLVRDYKPWHGDGKLLGLYIHRFNKKIT